MILRIPTQKPPPGVGKLLNSLRKFALPWSAPIIAIDGRPGVGKTTLGRYLAWQLGITLIETDLYRISTRDGIKYRIRPIQSLIEHRHRRGRPVIVEGIRLLETLKDTGNRPNYLIWMKNSCPDVVDEDSEIEPGPLTLEVNHYLACFDPETKADYIFPEIKS